MNRVRTRVKICGLREGLHAVVAADAGADAIGLVFYRESPRFVTPGAAANIVALLPPFVTSVGLFVDADAAKVKDTLASVRLDMLQFHGNETPRVLRFLRPAVRACRAHGSGDRFARMGWSFFDCPRAPPGHAYSRRSGGTGRTFDWAMIPRDLPIPVILSGGLTAENVGQAVREVQPWAVDVSSGVEASRGSKDPRKIVEFIRSVRIEDARSPG
jgi:phosphoribosylanthranilate isomerase